MVACWTGWPLADGGEPLPLAAPVLEQWTPEWNSHYGRDGALHWPSSMGLPLTEAVLPSASADYLTCHPSPQVAPSLKKQKQADCIKILSNLEGSDSSSVET